MDDAARLEILDWLHGAALDGTRVGALLDGFARRLVEAGVALQRAVIGVDTLHPTLEGYYFEWWRDAAQVKQTDYVRSSTDIGRWEHSPFHRLHVTGETWLRRWIEAGEGIDEFPIIADLKAAGATDYVGMRHRLTGDNAIAGIDAVYSSWSSDRPGGLGQDGIDALVALTPAFSLAVKSASYAQVARNLAETYLGRDVGARILAGGIVRGQPDKLDAVVWFSDLESFTRITDTSPPEAIIAFLNDYAEAVVEAIHEMKGEVLKFMGDGVLAIFHAPDPEDACRRALGAVLGARRRIEALNERRQRDGQPATQLYLGLHSGEIFYGNIGAPDRLDFTAVGPAVNQTSRIAAMCRSLDQQVLVSAEFAARAGDARARLISVGRYALRGLGRPVELFTLDPEIAA